MSATATRYDVHRPKLRRGDAEAAFYVRADTSDVKAITEVYERNAYQRPRSGFTVNPGSRWVDLGANVGSFTVMASGRGARVLRAVEAEKANVDLTAMNVSLNERGRIPVIHAAVVPDTWVLPYATLHVNRAALALRRHSITKARKDSVPVQVPVLRWSESIAEADGAKVNIEGAEVEILQTALAEGAFGDLRKLVFEWSFDIEPRIAVLRSVVDGLAEIFDEVQLSKRIPWDEEVWRFYPPNVYVFASR